MLERNGKRVTVPFGALVNDPSNNIYARANDTIYLYSEPQTFVAFGAVNGAVAAGGLVGTQGQINFGAWRLSLAEAVAKAGGLNDSQADPASIFIYRGEPRNIANELGIDVSQFNGTIIPVVYNINLRDPAGYFLATTFAMRNKDVVFAANATAVEDAKVMNYIRLVTGTVNDPIVAATNAVLLRDLVRVQ
jgi:polysaccharide export outer membrane protein